MVVAPSRFIKWLPTRFDGIASKVFKRWIAADTLCDSDVDTMQNQAG
jgi:hypothetical protein